MKLNHFICPNCGHDWYEDCSYATCARCNTFFYLSGSQTLPAWPNFTMLSSAGGYQPRPLDAAGIEQGSLKGKITFP